MITYITTFEMYYKNTLFLIQVDT